MLSNSRQLAGDNPLSTTRHTIYPGHAHGGGPRRRPLTLAVIAALALAGDAAAQAAFTPLGDLPGGAIASRALSVSADGSVVVGYSASALGDEAFRWSAAAGMVGLGDLPGGGFNSFATGVSANGSVIVGTGRSASGTEAFQWTGRDGMVGLGDLPGGVFESRANGVSADGSVVVGYGNSASGYEAFRWTAGGGMAGLGDLPGGIFYSIANAASGDGSVIVGFGNSAAGGEAFRWTAGGGMVGLGDLPGGTFASTATAVSTDGSVVVGRGASASGTEAFRWTAGTGMVGLGDLPGGIFQSQALGVSGNGSVVVGYGSTAAGTEAFRWTEGGGMQSVRDWLAAAGVTVAPGFSMSIANAVSADGSVLVGECSGPSGTEACIARDGSGAVSMSGLGSSLADTARGARMMLTSDDLVINGAHSRPLSRRVAPGKKTLWVAGDWGRDDHGTRSGNLGLAEVGGGLHLGPAQLNVALGQTWNRQVLSENGLAKADGTYVLAQALMPLDGNVWATVGVYGSTGRNTLRRGYLNAGTQDYSTGQSPIRSWGLRARLDWENAVQAGALSVSPYLDLSHFRATMEGYTETGGGFAARFNSQSAKSTYLRLGGSGGYSVGNNTQLVGMIEAAHRIEPDDGRATGQVIGLFDFDLPSETRKRTWLRAGIGVEGRIGDGVGSFMLNATTRGGVASQWIAASWRTAF